MINLVYFSPTDFPSSKSHTVQILHTAHAMARAGARVELVVSKLDGAPEAVLRGYGLEPHPNLTIGPMSRTSRRLNRWHGRSFRSYVPLMMASHRLRGPTVYYLRGATRALNLIPELAKWKRLFGARVYFEFHTLQYLDLADRHKGRYGEGEKLVKFLAGRRDLERRAYESLDGLVAITPKLRDLVVETFGLACPTQVCGSGARLNEPLPAPVGSAASGANDETNTARDLDALYVGNLYDFNGVDNLIAAMAEVPGRRLTLIGSGSDEDLARSRATAERAGVADRVEFCGFAPHPQALAAMRRARVVVAPLRKGSIDRVDRYCSPAKLIEYMASGAAILATRLESIEQTLADGRNALLVEPNSPRALAEGLRALLDDPALSARLAGQALADVREHTFDARARRILNFVASPAPVAEAASP